MLALIIEIAIFAHLVWLGLYMLNRAGDDAVLRQAGRTVLVLAVALAFATVGWPEAFGQSVVAPELLAGVGVLFLAGGIACLQRRVRESGEALLPDLLRSYDYSFLISVVFGGQVALAMAAG